MLEALQEIEIATKLLSSGDVKENPIDTHYQELNCPLVAVEVIIWRPYGTDLTSSVARQS